MTKAQEQLITELYLQGYKNTEIAKRVGVERHTIGRFVKQHNLISPNNIQIGQKYGSLTVIQMTNHRDGAGRIKWLCQCDCGNTIEVVGTALKSGSTKSCGCSRIGKQLIDLTGQRFGKLVVIKRVENTKNNKVQWLCQCDCGNLYTVQGEHLRNGSVKSCGCLHSTGEFLIEKILKQYDINYIHEYKFSDLLSDKNYPLRFDFALFKNDQLYCLVEYQGIQHYNKNNQWHTSSLEKNDTKKIKYCQLHNYNLIIINKLDDIEPIIINIISKIND